jgi:two-component system sensor histidine kinase RegB
MVATMFEPSPSDSALGRVKQDFAPWDAIAGRGRLRMRTLISLRWRGVIGQAVVLLLVWLRGLEGPYLLCGGLVVASAVTNFFLAFRDAGHRQATDSETAGVLGFDILQLSMLLYLTGGVLNPFCMLLIAPVALAAATVRTVYAAILGGIAILAVALMARFGAWPLPWRPGEVFETPGLYRWGMATALISGIAFTTSYAWRASVEAARMELALNVTQTVLAREQRLSALGALAAAAAHELGTPLATIQIVAKEIARESEAGALKDDAMLLVSQAERCREILRRLTDEPETEDEMHARLSLTQFVNEVIGPHLDSGVRVEAVVSGPPGETAPEIRRFPEMLHAMTSFVENAVDFAASEVLVRSRFDSDSIVIEVRDDGPGFSPDVLLKLGQPYVTSRPGGEGSRTGHVGMGLGFFIAKTLLERTGAVVVFHNARGGGALVSARWPRAILEAPPSEIGAWGLEP